MMKKLHGLLLAMSMVPTFVSATTAVVTHTHKAKVPGIQSGTFFGVEAGVANTQLFAEIDEVKYEHSDGNNLGMHGSAVVGYRKVLPSKMAWSVFLQGGYENQKVEKDILIDNVDESQTEAMLEHNGKGFLVAGVDLGFKASASVVPFFRIGYKGQAIETTLTQFGEGEEAADVTDMQSSWSNGLRLGLGVDYAIDSSWSIGLFAGLDLMQSRAFDDFLVDAEVTTRPSHYTFAVTTKYTFS